MFAKLSAIIGSALIAIGSWFSPMQAPQPPLSGDTQLFVGGSTYYLSGSGVTSSATSLTLTSLTLPQNSYKIQDADLSDTFYMTLEPGSKTKQEFVSCTTVTQNSAGTATLSGCTRGLSPISPYTASSTLQFAHGGGTSAIFSNPPQLYNDAAFKGNDETVTGIFTFNGIPRYQQVPTAHSSGTHASTTAEFASVAMVNAVVVAGGTVGTHDTAGIFKIASGLEMASTTATRDGYSLVLTSNFATSTPGLNATSTIPITMFNGKLNSNFQDLTANYTWAGVQSFSGNTNNTGTALVKNLNASSTAANPIVLNGVSYDTPSAQGASSTALLNNGSGNLKWQPVPHFLAASTTLVQKSVGVNRVWVPMATTTATLSVAGNVLVTVSASSSAVNNGPMGAITLFVDNVDKSLGADGFDNYSCPVSSQCRGAMPLKFTYMVENLTAGMHFFTVYVRNLEAGAPTTNYDLQQVSLTYVGQ